MNTYTLPTTPSLRDGYHGASDASILERSDPEDGICHVQSTASTRDLLHRAGFARVRTHAFYPVPVFTDDLRRLQLAPKKP